MNIHANISFICNSQNGNNPDINKWMDKQIVYIHTIEYHSPITKNEMLIHIWTWINLNNYGERKNIPKNMYIVYKFICIEF